MPFQKIDKEFCLTDNSVNVYGYRLLTEGLQLERFKPAIGFLMHDRSKGVAVKWEDFRLEGDKLFAKPVVNSNLFPDLAAQIEDGFYGCASVGHIVALEISEKEALRAPGQTGVTVTKWFPRECSIVDIGGNFNAIAKLYDETDNVLQDLSAQTQSNNQNQNQMNESLKAILVLLNLKAETTNDELNIVLQNLQAKAAKSDVLEKELSDLKASQCAEKINSITEKGIAERKLTVEVAAQLKKDYANNPEGLKALVDAMKPQELITSKPGNVPDNLPEKYKGKTYQQLYVSGELTEVKKNFPEYFETLKSQK